MSIKNFKKNINRCVYEMKYGWNLLQLPDHILNLEKKWSIKILKIIGLISTSLMLSGYAQQFHRLFFYYIATYSLIYLIYRLYIAIYITKESIALIFSGKLLVYNSPFNPYLTAFRAFSSVTKNVGSITVGTGITYSLCIELDEILLSEGKKPLFVPKIKEAVQKSGLQSQLSDLLKRLGLEDTVSSDKPIPVDTSSFLDSLDDKGRDELKRITGQSWEEIKTSQLKIHKALQSIKNGTDSSGNESNTILSLIDKENPFNIKK